LSLDYQQNIFLTGQEFITSITCRNNRALLNTSIPGITFSSI
jgi:hypothetical protein